MEGGTGENGSTTRCMVVDSIHGKMVVGMRANTSLIKSMEWALTHGPTVAGTLGNGSTASATAGVK